VRSAQRLKAFVGGVSENFAQHFAGTARFLDEPWFIDAIDTSGSLTVQGWAFVDEPRPGGDYSDRFSFNGRRFDRVDYPLERKDVGDCFRARQRAKECGFVLVASRIQAAPWR
jgi:hypothetical protein